MTPELRDSYKIDRTGWASGPWDGEPDRIDFTHAGLNCLMLRARSGHWCGYAGLPPTHKLHGKDYWGVDVDCHGGLTYADACAGNICHVPAPGEPEHLWWFGFDCHHSNDMAPEDTTERMRQFAWGRGGSYRDAGYVRRQTERLAEQLKELN